ncbi:MAG: Rieske (2Fe-2S) protein [Gemmatimonas sp.]
MSNRTLTVLDRREFLAQSTLMALGALVASACGDGLSGSPTGPGAVNVTVQIASYTALAAIGGIARLNGTGTPIAVVHSTSTTYRAFSLICPHAGTTVGITGASFRCPNHGATFASTGSWTGGERTSGLFEFTVAHDATAGTLTIVS